MTQYPEPLLETPEASSHFLKPLGDFRESAEDSLSLMESILKTKIKPRTTIKTRTKTETKTKTKTRTRNRTKTKTKD